MKKFHQFTAIKKNWFQCCLKFTSTNGYEADPGGRALCGCSITVIANSNLGEGMECRLLCLFCVL
jgi:hypothetical protein